MGQPDCRHRARIVGDHNRALVLAEFVMRNFQPCTVADVAGGQGNLSMWLALHGYDCTVIDPRNTTFSKRWRAQVKRNRLHIKRLRREYCAAMAQDYELVIGLHPDGATRELALSVQIAPAVVIVPCCNMWARGQDVSGLIEDTWNRLGATWWSTQLPMGGKNVVYVGRA